MNDDVAALFGGMLPFMEFVEQIYAAAENPQLWAAVLDRLMGALEGGDAELFGSTVDAGVTGLAVIRGVEGEAFAEYAAYYAARNPWMLTGEQIFGHEGVWMSHLAPVEGTLERTEFYQDFLRRWGMYHSAGVLLHEPGTPLVQLTLQRPKDRGHFGPSEERALAMLRPHFARAVRQHGKLRGLEAEAHGLKSALEATGHAVVGVNAQGQVVMTNSRAAALLGAGEGLRLTVDGCLACEDPADTVALMTLLGNRFAMGSSAMTVRRRSASTLTVTAMPMSGSLAEGASCGMVMMLFLGDAAAVPASRAETMRSLYRLTPTEARVCDLLLAGLDAREVGEALAISVDTARFYVKQILSKTGARRQSALMRLMMVLPGV